MAATQLETGFLEATSKHPESQSVAKANEFLHKMRKLGLIQKPAYNIESLDTVGKKLHQELNSVYKVK